MANSTSITDAIDVQQYAVSDADTRLNTNQIIRHHILGQLLTDDQGVPRIPKDKDSLQAVTTLLKDSDRSELTRKRLVVDNAQAEADMLAAKVLERVAARANTRLRIDDQPTGHYGPVVDVNRLPHSELPTTIFEPVGTPVDLDAVLRSGRAATKGIPQNDQDQPN